jgi:hypothetical protein
MEQERLSLRKEKGVDFDSVLQAYNFGGTFLDFILENGGFYTLELAEAPFNEYIKNKRKDGINLSVMSVVIAAIIRLVALRPSLNRFVMNGVLYARNEITLSITIKKKLSEQSPEENLKLHFTGKESVFEVQQIIDAEIGRLKRAEESNDAGLVMKLFAKMPNFIVKFLVNMIIFSDKHNMLPKFLIKASPFHTTVYFTNLMSIKLDKVYHHLYNFGTAGNFVSLGKVMARPIIKDGQIASEKFFKLGLTVDERMCDGMYFSGSLRLLEKMLKDFSSLEEPLDEVASDID